MFLSKIAELIRNVKIDCSAVIVAAGSAKRFGSDKLSVELLGKPVLSYSLSAFQSCEYVKEIVVVVSENSLMDVANLCDLQGFTKVSKIVIGGRTRLESALCGVCECREDAGLIAIHDGARPLASLDVIKSAIECALVHKAAAPAVLSRDTVKISSGGVVSHTPDRESVYCIQTPQVFDPVIIKGALTNAVNNDLKIFDDASAVEALGLPVFLSQGSEENIKITTPLDLKLAEIILTERNKTAAAD